MWGMISCKKSSQLVSQSLDIKLPLTQRLFLKLHLMMCSVCREYAKQIQQIHYMLYQFAHPIEEDLSIKLPSFVKERFYESLNE